MPRLIDVLTDEERTLPTKVRGLRRSARELEGDVDRLSQRRVELEGLLDSLIKEEANYHKLRENQFPVFDEDPG